ncbi:hypothetical protein QL285_042399 [Trifolium repens]|nr:hypothetical protein QL285_042399 [Trifolium repens]
MATVPCSTDRRRRCYLCRRYLRRGYSYSLLPSLVHSEQEFQIKILKSRYLKRIYCFSSLIGATIYAYSFIPGFGIFQVQIFSIPFTGLHYGLVSVFQKQPIQWMKLFHVHIQITWRMHLLASDPSIVERMKVMTSGSSLVSLAIGKSSVYTSKDAKQKTPKDKSSSTHMDSNLKCGKSQVCTLSSF